MNKFDIEYYARRITATYGSNVLVSILSKYDSSSINDLPACYYQAFLDDLMLMDEDD